jgi:heme ABC exporter ATP-binding subunit CcmA
MTATARHADIELAGVARTFGPVAALVGIDLTIPAGASVALMGGNGAGKSTLLRVIAGLAAPTMGTVRLAGVDRRRAGPGLRALVGFVAHESMLYADLTVRENLAFHASLHGLGEAAVEEAAARFDVAHALDRTVRVLSRGNRQRASLARASLHDPAILLLDEPYTGLDLDSAERLTAIIGDLHRRGRTVVMSVHDAAHAVQADRLVVLADGRIVVDRPVGEDACADGVAALLRAASRHRSSAEVGAERRMELAP